MKEVHENLRMIQTGIIGFNNFFHGKHLLESLKRAAAPEFGEIDMAFLGKMA